jgi:hypothetical protein
MTGNDMSKATEQRIAEEVDKTLRAFDHDDLLEENPFLVTRLKARVSSRSTKRHEGYFVRFNPKYVVVAFILVINLVTVVHYLDWNNTQHLHEKLVSQLQEDLQIDQSQNAF